MFLRATHKFPNDPNLLQEPWDLLSDGNSVIKDPWYPLKDIHNLLNHPCIFLKDP